MGVLAAAVFILLFMPYAGIFLILGAKDSLDTKVGIALLVIGIILRIMAEG